MIKIKSFGSSSKGNGYLIDDGQTQLLIECGIKLDKVKKEMNFDFSKVAGCFITHEHKDHCGYVEQLIKQTPVDVYATAGTLSMLNIDLYRQHALIMNYPKKVGTWKVTPFEINHDVVEPCGFIFENQVGEKLLFVTDTYYVKYRFKEITHLMVEMNYSKEIIKKNVSQEHYNKVLKSRVIESHFEMENSLKFIESNMSNKLKEVWLLHLSESNSNKKLFLEETQKLTGVPVYIA